MAQTKTKSPSKRRSSTRKSSSRKRTTNAKSASTSKQTNSSKSAPASSMSKAADKATNAVGNATGKATSAVGKAKVPLLAGGAALAGAAGGLALGARGGRRGKGIAKAIPRRPQMKMKVRSKDLASAAKDVGTFGAQLGHLANELQQARESGNGKHRSPLEVVLEGLTARRSRR
jgi:hypothetical protein